MGNQHRWLPVPALSCACEHRAGRRNTPVPKHPPAAARDRRVREHETGEDKTEEDKTRKRAARAAEKVGTIRCDKAQGKLRRGKR
ncbi:hypothetical protein BL254_05120 [Protofrankia sp. BMG5.30]|uniref:Uncharacterized protein n=1 Tax=Protofrankia coriariae TaxID=1562887 RepID=A0ABR5F626_9ACTN|nr:hypothetical protein FrCorBMG51_06785 [Protofrankia coriariae]ONH37037.1 hypothetical protein BL254_05120 [Protofrankia sp. BMG5.30]